MRVLTVGNLYPPHGEGGYEVVWRSFAAHLRARGDAVRVLCSDMRRPGVGGEADTDVHRDLRWYWRDRVWLDPGLRATLSIERHNRAVLRRHLADFAPDAVMWWSMGGMSLSLIEQARRAGIPAVGVVHDGWLAYGVQRDGWTRRARNHPRLARLAAALTGVPARVDLARAGTWTFNSAKVLEWSRRERWDVGDPVIVYPGIDARRFVPAPPRPWDWRLACVGRVEPEKGVATVVEALAQLPPAAVLDVTGPGPDAELTRLRALAGRLGVADRVRLNGPWPQDRLGEAYAAADAVVFPVVWDEPFGLVPLEAMATGRPVVATGTGGSAEYLRDGQNALLFPAGDAPSLARALERLAGDAALREHLRGEGLATAARFTEAAFNERLEAILRRTAATCGRAGRRGARCSPRWRAS